jgi:extracellular factor (EF) 3-hydroxypalmitic acid methyl ester biosynthesis protein
MADNLNKDYKSLIDSLKTFLEKVEAEVNLKETEGEKSERLIRLYEPILFKKLDKTIKELEKIASNFDKEEHKVHKEYLQKEIHPIALKSPFNKRCFEKSLGYSGDYLMMEMIYSNPYQGDSILSQLLNAHSLTLPIVKAVRKRSQYIKKTIEETVKKIPCASIFNVGAGPAWEIREFFKETNECNAKFYLLDQEKKALEFVKKRLDSYPYSISFLNTRVARLIREGFKIKFDFIYSMGLLDYFSDRFARRLIQSLCSLLNEGGKLIIGNARYNPHRIWMEHGVEWYLKYRNEEELLKLADGLYPIPRKIYVKEEKEIGKIFLFLVVER